MASGNTLGLIVIYPKPLSKSIIAEVSSLRLLGTKTIEYLVKMI